MTGEAMHNILGITSKLSEYFLCEIQNENFTKYFYYFPNKNASKLLLKYLDF